MPKTQFKSKLIQYNNSKHHRKLKLNKNNNICHKHWRKCICNSECITSQINWDSVREKISQENPRVGDLATLDCYFYPPNIKSIGVIIKTKKDLIYIYFGEEEVEITESSNIFIFGENSLDEEIKDSLVRSYNNSRIGRLIRLKDLI